MEEDGADKEAAPQPPETNFRDGLIDFAPYSIGQLQELQFSIDPAAFPQNHARLLAALKEKEGLVAPPASSGAAVAGRFTPRGGLLGWFQSISARSPVYGFGSIEAGTDEIVLSGRQRTWLGVPVEAQISCEIAQVQNVALDGASIHFEIKRRNWPANRISFRPQSSDRINELLARLPASQSEGVQKSWAAVRGFNRRLDSIGGRPVVTAILVALNCAVYAAIATAIKRFGSFTPQELLGWGANLGTLTVNGQWWRLFTALFVHFNLPHILLNMWALWNIGRLTERLFGHATLLSIYVASGILASLASVAWDPSLSSVGASGAIFGLFGAYLAFLSRQRNEIPKALLLRHWISTSAFVLFNLINGAVQTGIDNAAHVGGLLAGLALGFLLARPLDPEVRKQLPVKQYLAAAAFVAIAILSAVWQVKGIGSELTVSEKYFRRHSAYANGEAENLRLWNELARRASAGAISDAELGQRFEQEILPFWQTQSTALEKENKTLKGPERDYGLLVAAFAKSRYDWATTLIEAVKNNDSSRMEEIAKLVANTAAVSAKLERIAIRSRMDHRPRALSASPWVIRTRAFFSPQSWKCVGSPFEIEPSIRNSDDKNDGPAIRDMLGCRAQQWFMSGDYDHLESSMNRYVETLEDLPDGSSSYEGIVGGLNDLFRYGGLAPEVALGHTADWRRRFKNSTMADLAEAEILTDWAWSARGTGFANSVSSQNMAAYTYRTVMAAAALDDLAVRAANNPLWYSLSLDVGLDQSIDKEKLRATFDRGFAKAPGYRPLYRAMLRTLMPRWGGSYDEVDRLINQIYDKTVKTRGYERYAELYSAYAWLEGDELDLFADTPAFWSGMSSGYTGLLKRYPKSNAVVNRYAYFACRAEDKTTYNQLRSAVGKGLSAAVWSKRFTLETCDKKLASSGEFYVPLHQDPSRNERVKALGGMHLGMTRKELLAAKGSPAVRRDGYWVYNSVDTRHYGVLTAVFSAPEREPEGVVEAIAYSGDEMSSPLEIPYLDDLSSVEILQKYAPQIKGQLTLSGEMTFTFPNGIYVNTHDEKVYRYGIISLP